MNLELLDPFRRQVPDRVDSTLSLPESLLLPQATVDKTADNNNNKSSSTKEPPAKPLPPIAAQHIAFNRRGNYVAVGYANGTVAVFDILSRTVSSLYRMKIVTTTTTTTPEGKEQMDDHHHHHNGITSLSWSRRSRTLLVGSMGSPRLMLIDTTHPQGPKECGVTSNMQQQQHAPPIPKSSKKDKSKKNAAAADEDEDDDEKERSSPAMGGTSFFASGSSRNRNNASSFATTLRDQLDRQPTMSRHVPTKRVVGSQDSTTTDSQATQSTKSTLLPLMQALTSDRKVRRYPSITFDMPHAVSQAQVHPKDPLTGHAVLQDGSLVVFAVSAGAFDVNNTATNEVAAIPPVIVSPVVLMEQDGSYFVTCSCLDPHGEKLYAGTQDGKLLGFDVKELWDQMGKDSPTLPTLKPSFVISIPGGAAVWGMVVSRNGKSIVVNSADAALRLYNTVECWATPEQVEKPTFVFQDVVNKVKFGSCDISGDGEYVAGGAQGHDTKYEVYIWNTSTGVLADKLTGAPVDLHSVAWQPTRSFLAVAASDGLVDVWGPRINWTAFAPDFQALPHNVEYVEREDEFDEVVDATDNNGDGKNGKDMEDDDEKEHVDILTLHKIPMFQSDSEDEEEVFHFDVVRRPTGASSS